MSVDILKLKALATAAKRDQYDNVALNDYGMAMAPAVTLELIAEIERHRQVNAEGCKPDSSIPLSGLSSAGAASCHSLDTAEGCKPDLINSPAQRMAATRRLSSVLPTAAVEGDELVIRITTECLIHAVTCFSQWPVNEAGEPIRINNGPRLVQEIIYELQREDEQGTNPMHRMLDEAALDALNHGSEAVDYDEVSP